MKQPKRPTPAQLQAATLKKLRDVIAPGLQVLFCGINPGLYSAATGHHFARPGNRFWPALHAAGITERLFHPAEQRQLLALGYGITNVVARASAAADEISAAELTAGGALLVRKVLRYQPKCLAVLGLGAYRAAFASKAARLGRQAEQIGDTTVWVLPNPSGLNAHYQAADLAALFRKVREFALVE